MNDTVGEVESIAPLEKWRGQGMKVLIVLAAISIVAFAAISYGRKGPNLVWYVSPPIDAQGRRLHVLSPAGWVRWGPIRTTNGWDKFPRSQSIDIVLGRNIVSQDRNFVRKWLIRMRLMRDDDPLEKIRLSVGPDLYSGCPAGHQTAIEDIGAAYAAEQTQVKRAVGIPGGGLEAGAVYIRSGTSADSNELGKTICNSLYVK